MHHVHSRQHPLDSFLMQAAVAGLAGNIAAGFSEAILKKTIPAGQKAKELKVRDASPHEKAGPTFGTKLVGRELTATERKAAKAAFTFFYGVGWGLIFAGVKRKLPQLARLGGVPFGLAAFVACDGMIAPLLRLSPTVTKLPWAINAKEMTNHAVWAIGAQTAMSALEPKTELEAA